MLPCVQGSAYWEVAAGYVGALSADIPLTSLGSDPVSLRVEEALITVRPRTAGALDPEPTPASTGGDGGGSGTPGEGGGGLPKGGGGGAGSPSAGDLEALGQAAVVDGVRLIAGGIEDVLQRLRIQVHSGSDALAAKLECQWAAGSSVQLCPARVHMAEASACYALAFTLYHSLWKAHARLALGAAERLKALDGRGSAASNSRPSTLHAAPPAARS